MSENSGDQELQDTLDLVADIFEKMGLNVDVDGQVDGRFLRLNVTGADADALVQGSGAAASSKVLDAVQLVTTRSQHGGDGGRTVVIDVGGFREERGAQLEGTAQRLADRAVKHGDVVRIWGMNSFDRRAVHLALKEHTKVRSDSEGEGVFRVLCVSAVKPTQDQT